jgi:hypothetical protein
LSLRDCSSKSSCVDSQSSVPDSPSVMFIDTLSFRRCVCVWSCSVWLVCVCVCLFVLFA